MRTIFRWRLLAHLRLDRLQLLGAADRHVVLMLLETSNQFATTRLHARTYPLRVGLARRESAASGFLGMRGVLIDKCDQSDRKRSERNVANTHCRDLPCLRRKSYVTNELDSSPTAKRSDALAAELSRPYQPQKRSLSRPRKQSKWFGC